MAFDATVLQVFIASPSDVQEERDVITSTLYRWNALHSFKEKIVLLPVKWETHAWSEFRGTDTQEILNKQFVRDCDILIGVFWSKIGTSTFKSNSGTLEEIEEFIHLGKPIKIYFAKKNLPDDIDIEQLTKLREFKKIYQSMGIYMEYNTIPNLQSILMDDITREVHSYKSRNEETEISQVPSIKVTRFELGTDNEKKK